MDRLARWSDAFIDEALAAPDRFGPIARDLRGHAPRWAQEHGVQQVFRHVRRWFGRSTPVLIDRQRTSDNTRLRPDAQFNNPARRGRPTHVEVDTDPDRMRAHVDARAPGVRSVFLLVDPATGALVEKHVYPVRGREYIRRARPGRGLTLTRRYVFDAFEG